MKGTCEAETEGVARAQAETGTQTRGGATIDRFPTGAIRRLPILLLHVTSERPSFRT